jgi:hypothetical protein
VKTESAKQMKCVNNNCDKDPHVKNYPLLATADGDFACDEKCLKVFYAQRDRFFNTTIHSEELTKDYLHGK